MGFEKVKNIRKKFIFYSENKPFETQLLFIILFGIPVLAEFVLFNVFVKELNTAYSLIILILIILTNLILSISLISPILELGDKYIKIKVKNKLIIEINEINKYYLKNKKLFLVNLLLNAIIMTILAFLVSTVLFSSPNTLNSLFQFITFCIEKYKSITLILMILVVFPYAILLPVFWVLSYFLTGLILLKIDKFIKRNQPQLEVKEEKPYENI